ncbi:MAG: ATP-binding protein [Polyangiales bacterium]
MLSEDLRALEEENRTLRESERRFRALIEKATDVLYVVDASFVVRFWSPGASAALGWTQDEAIGRQGLELIHPDDLALITPPSADAPVGSGIRLSYRVRHRDGSYRHLDATVRNLLADGAVQGIIVNARDVTEQRRAEARSAESQRLESLGRLAGGVAHDFNNLLTVILNCSEFVLEAMQAGEPPLADDLHEIRAAGNRARDLTRQLLAFARRQVIAPIVLDLNALIAESERLLTRVLGEHVSLATDLDPRPCVIRCDPSQLQQVILNLLVNARDAMPHGGRIEVETRILPDDARARAQVSLRVRDHGVGMTGEVRDHLFEPFFTTKPKGAGTGLGLATVYGIVHQSGGTISVESEPGRGSTFEILLPHCPEPPTSTAPPPAEPPKANDEIVLLVEDERSVAEVAVRILRKAGYNVLSAGDGEAAIALSREVPRLDLLLSDVVMPGLNGPQIADAVRMIHPGVRVLFMSGYDENLIGRPSDVHAAFQFIPKPFSPGSLLSRVREVLTSAAGASPIA